MKKWSSTCPRHPGKAPTFPDPRLLRTVFLRRGTGYFSAFPCEAPVATFGPKEGRFVSARQAPPSSPAADLGNRLPSTARWRPGRAGCPQPAARLANRRPFLPRGALGTTRPTSSLADQPPGYHGGECPETKALRRDRLQNARICLLRSITRKKIVNSGKVE